MGTMVVDCPATPAPLETEPTLERCSEALRRGAAWHGQARGAFYDPVSRTTCALAALVVGLIGAEAVEAGWSDSDCIHKLVLRRTGVDLGRKVICPASNKRKELDLAIMTMNDRAGWSREKIADWLESLGL